MVCKSPARLDADRLALVDRWQRLAYKKVKIWTIRYPRLRNEFMCEAMLELCVSAATWEEDHESGTPFDAYLSMNLRSARNRVIRSAARSLPPLPSSDLYGDNPDPSEVMAQAEVVAAAFAALKKPRQREWLGLRLDGLNDYEIARAWGVPRSNVTYLRDQIREILMRVLSRESAR